MGRPVIACASILSTAPLAVARLIPPPRSDD
jgi:hypothetical protein